MYQTCACVIHTRCQLHACVCISVVIFVCAVLREALVAPSTLFQAHFDYKRIETEKQLQKGGKVYCSIDRWPSY